ncbi:MAG: hypothetical protein Q9P90_04620 [candidate division KSB1 bacterium]|nr:hypothetical protein [candidate division KSB1 bacterium]
MHSMKTRFEIASATSTAYRSPFMAVTATLELYDDEITGSIELSGLVAGSDAQSLAQFLRKLTVLPAQRWILRLNQVNALSLKGLQAILKFAKYVRRRGAVVVIRQTNPIINNLIQEMDVSCYFK